MQYETWRAMFKKTDYNENALIQEYFEVYIEPKISDLQQSLDDTKRDIIQTFFVEVHTHHDVRAFHKVACQIFSKESCDALELLYYLVTGDLKDDDCIINSLKTISVKPLEELYLLVASEIRKHIINFFEEKQDLSSFKIRA